MEIALPLIALGSLYFASNTTSSSSPTDDAVKEHFQSVGLPNVDLPDVNYAPVMNHETDLTSQLSTTQKYDTPYAYTDKYFNANAGPDIAAIKKNEYAGKVFQSLTGSSVDPSYYQHNNMVPFFGSTVRSRLLDENSNEGLMDAMNGAGSQNLRKKEQAPLFTPGNNLQWTHGMPTATDFIQSRMNVSNKLNGVKPFEEIRVGPGLGKDMQNVSYGFNSGMMSRDAWMPKTVDDLRVANKQKTSGLLMEGREGPAMSRIVNRGYQAPVEKNRPDRMMEMDESRYFTTLASSGAAQTLRGETVDRPEENRATATTSYIGVASAPQDAAYVTGEYMPSTRIDLGEVPLAPMDAAGHQGAFDGDFGLRTMKSYTNNRSTTGEGAGYFGAFSGAMGAVVAPLLDILRPSKKQNTIGTMRPYHNPQSTVKSSYVKHEDDRPGPTIREMTENSKGHVFLQASKDRTGYLSSGWDAPATNRQDMTGYYSGIVGTALAKEPRAYDAEYRQRNNEIKSSTVAGRVPNGNAAWFQNEVNVRNKEGLETDLMRQQRTTVATRPSMIPDAAMMGRMTGAQSLYGNMNMDRMDPGVLEALQSNPFAMRSANGF